MRLYSNQQNDRVVDDGVGVVDSHCALTPIFNASQCRKNTYLVITYDLMTERPSIRNLKFLNRKQTKKMCPKISPHVFHRVECPNELFDFVRIIMCINMPETVVLKLDYAREELPDRLVFFLM